MHTIFSGPPQSLQSLSSTTHSFFNCRPFFSALTLRRAGIARNAVVTQQVNAVVVVAVELLAAHTAADVVATLALLAVAGHGGPVLVARPAVSAWVRQQQVLATATAEHITAWKENTSCRGRLAGWDIVHSWSKSFLKKLRTALWLLRLCQTKFWFHCELKQQCLRSMLGDRSQTEGRGDGGREWRLPLTYKGSWQTNTYWPIMAMGNPNCTQHGVPSNLALFLLHFSLSDSATLYFVLLRFHLGFSYSVFPRRFYLVELSLISSAPLLICISSLLLLLRISSMPPLRGVFCVLLLIHLPRVILLVNLHRCVYPSACSRTDSLTPYATSTHLRSYTTFPERFSYSLFYTILLLCIPWDIPLLRVPW